jgi:uncharacterized protein (DUF924 family)
MFIIGTGSLFPEIPPRNLYNGSSRAVAAALAVAIDTARIAFAPSFDLSFVPSLRALHCQQHKYLMHPFPRIASAIVVIKYFLLAL